MTTTTPLHAALTDLQEKIHGTARSKGWWDPCLLDGFATKLERDAVEETIPEKLMLIVSELSEALEEYRAGYDPRASRVENGKPEGFLVECADAVIRIFDLAGALEGDLAGAITTKMAYNATRPHRHGGKRA